METVRQILKLKFHLDYYIFQKPYVMYLYSALQRIVKGLKYVYNRMINWSHGLENYVIIGGMLEGIGGI